MICGGPMMGLAQPSGEVGVTKTTSGLLLLSGRDVRDFLAMPCIGCGRCVEACPACLMPNELSRFIEAEDYASADGYGVLDCIECGCCAYVCPARRPLVQHMKQGKAWAAAKRREAKKP
jgi:electron transport complex protein RnfC